MSKNRDVPTLGHRYVVEKEPGPICKAFSLERVKHGWVFITITFRGNEILEVERCEPDLKVIIIEKYKIASQRYFNSIG